MTHADELSLTQRAASTLLVEYIRAHIPQDDIAEFLLMLVGRYVRGNAAPPDRTITDESALITAILPGVKAAISAHKPIDRAAIAAFTGLSGGAVNQLIHKAIATASAAPESPTVAAPPPDSGSQPGRACRVRPTISRKLDGRSNPETAIKRALTRAKNKAIAAALLPG